MAEPEAIGAPLTTTGLFADLDAEAIGEPEREPPPGIDLSLLREVPDEAETLRASRAAAWAAALSTARDVDKGLAAAAYALLSRDDSLVRVVAAWPSIDLSWDWPDCDPPARPVDALFAVWRLVWNPGDPKAQLPVIVAASTGLSVASALTALRVAVQNRLIFPGGAISVGAEAFLRAETAGSIRKLRGPTASAPSGG